MPLDPVNVTPENLRAAFVAALPADTSTHGAKPSLAHTYLPASHAKALTLEAMLVEGMRGAGKSFWWAALQSPDHRKLIGQQVAVWQELEVGVGFGESPSVDRYPGKDTLARLLESGIEPRLIWKTVVVSALPGADRVQIPPDRNWHEKVAWVAEHPEDIDRLLATCDDSLARENRHWLILFDALDRCGNDWPQMDALVRGLLQLMLELRPYRRLHGKCFLRPDQLEGRQVTNFPDASKVLAARAELTWPARDLYNLLWQYLLNAPEAHGELLRKMLQDVVRTRALPNALGVWQVPGELARDEKLQREVFHRLTGPWMGRAPRRGFPYTWAVNHLADARGQVSPRSFLAALYTAGEDTGERSPGHEWPLHYESIKRGVQRASQIRVAELAEDYPWIRTVMDPLKGLVVPCEFQAIEARWGDNKVVTRLKEATEDQRLPPEHLHEGDDGVRRDLEDLGLFQRMHDGRVNIPDLFRVGFGIGRRGGVKPVR